MLQIVFSLRSCLVSSKYKQSVALRSMSLGKCAIIYCKMLRNKGPSVISGFLSMGYLEIFMSFRKCFWCEPAHGCRCNQLVWWLSCKSQHHAWHTRQHPDSSNDPWTKCRCFYDIAPVYPNSKGLCHTSLRWDHSFAQRWRPSQASTGDLSHLDLPIHDGMCGCQHFGV